MLEDTTEAGRMKWSQSMATLANERNTVVKLSGFGTFIRRNDPAHIHWLISETVRLFGANRCLYGSNFPIEKLWTSYGALIDAHRQDAGRLSEAEQNAIFHDTACRVYRL
jgi:predicted TIM-barrel fold metal-dependent hydrolase